MADGNAARSCIVPGPQRLRALKTQLLDAFAGEASRGTEPAALAEVLAEALAGGGRYQPEAIAEIAAALRERAGPEAAQDFEFSRARPGPRYAELLAHYARMHAEGYAVEGADGPRRLAPQEAYPGNELPRFMEPIRDLVKTHAARTILDYGSGKGLQYAAVDLPRPDGETVPSIQAYWGVERIACYDPGVPAFAAFPEERFDGVVSTDVLEHCHAADLPWILREIFGLARRFVFLNIACHPAKARLPSGENAHCSVRHPEWWAGLVAGIADAFPGVDYLVCFLVPAHDEAGQAVLKPVWTRRAVYEAEAG